MFVFYRWGSCHCLYTTFSLLGVFTAFYGQHLVAAQTDRHFLGVAVRAQKYFHCESQMITEAETLS